MEPNTLQTEAIEALLRSIRRSLRTVKIMLGTFFVLILLMLATLGYVTYKVVTFTRDISSKISSIEDKTSNLLSPDTLKKSLPGGLFQ